MVDLILRRDVEVCFLSLNYDFFFETALISHAPANFASLSDYIPKDRNWRLIKLHGSINWGRRPKVQMGGTLHGNWRPYLDELDLQTGLEKEIQLIEYRDTVPCDAERTQLFYPALAIPVERKYEFVCPEEHIIAARDFLADCPNFLIVGCSMKDESIFNLLAESVRHARNLKIINGDLPLQSDTYDRIVTRHPFNYRWPDPIFDGGFDKFMSKNGIEKFLDTLT